MGHKKRLAKQKAATAARTSDRVRPNEKGLPKSLIAKKKSEKQAKQFGESVDAADLKRQTKTKIQTPQLGAQQATQQQFDTAQNQARADLAPVEPQQAPAIQVTAGPDQPKGFNPLTNPIIGGIPPIAIGVAGAIGLLFSTIPAITAVGNVARVGTKGLYKIIPTGPAGRFATNAATQATTASWLKKIYLGAATAAVGATAGLILAEQSDTVDSTGAVVGGAVIGAGAGLLAAGASAAGAAGAMLGIVGSYPFAGFIKEEALQTISFAITTAIKNGDQAGALEALEFQKILLDPESWAQIVGKVPYANVLQNLDLFYQAARIKMMIDERIIINMGLGETENEKFARIRQEEQDMFLETTRLSQEIIAQFDENERQARAEQRNKDAEFWAAQKAKERKLEEADRKAIADFWFEYKKRVQELASNNRPSNLKFGLL